MDPYATRPRIVLRPVLDIPMDDSGRNSLLPYLAHQTPRGQATLLGNTGEPVRICPHAVENTEISSRIFSLDKGVRLAFVRRAGD